MLSAFFILLLTWSSVEAAEIMNDAGNALKRSMTTPTESAETVEVPRLIKRKVVFWKYAPMAAFSDSNPPDLFRTITDATYCEYLPQEFKDFAQIFRTAWYAHEVDFWRNGEFDLELMKWAANSKITVLEFNTHVAFIIQLLRRHESFRSQACWDLIEEYLIFTFSHYRLARLSSEDFFTMCALSALALKPHIFKIIVKYRPAYCTDQCAGRIWKDFIQLAVNHNLILSATSTETTQWIKMFQLLCAHFGSFSNLPDVICTISKTSKIKRLETALLIQPLLSAFAKHNSILFEAIYNLDVTRFIISGMKLSKIILWIDGMLIFDQSIKRFDTTKQVELEQLADVVFNCLGRDISIEKLLEICAHNGSYHLAQFILMYSASARNSVPAKRDQCLLLKDLVKVNVPFDFDFTDIIAIVIGFDLKWDDLVEHLLPVIDEDLKETLLMESLQFILKVAESFPDNFDPSKPWSIPLQYPPSSLDCRCPFLYDAARIILARHYKIIPAATRTLNGPSEEACYRDLAWFMTFFINSCRPDLGPDYKILV